MKRRTQGMTLVEVVIGSAIISTAIVGLSAAFGLYVDYALSNQRNIQAAYLLEEGMEAMTHMRDSNWATYIARLSTTTTYYLDLRTTTTSFWSATTTPQYTHTVFLRKITVADVRRSNSNDQITSVVSGSTYDPNIKKITVGVEYPQGGATTTQTVTGYITNLQ